MRYEWLDDYLLQKRGVTKGYQPVWNWIRYHIGSKMFAALCLDKAHGGLLHQPQAGGKRERIPARPVCGHPAGLLFR